MRLLDHLKLERHELPNSLAPRAEHFPPRAAEQDGNLVAYRLGLVHTKVEAEQLKSCGDPIDVGLVLLRELRAAGYDLIVTWRKEP